MVTALRRMVADVIGVDGLVAVNMGPADLEEGREAVVRRAIRPEKNTR